MRIISNKFIYKNKEKEELMNKLKEYERKNNELKKEKNLRKK